MAIDTSKNLRFMSNNFLETGYAALSVSSEDAANPFTNAMDPQQRTKTFKFSGRFTIDASNNKIYINGNTYTLTPGEYTSGAALAAHISLVIAAENVSCQYSTLGLDFYFIALADWDLNLATVANAVWTTLGFTTGADAHVLSGEEKRADAVRIHYPNEEIAVDFGYQAAIGFIGIIGDLGQELKVPPGATIRFRANTVNDKATALVDVTIPWYERGAFRFIDDIAGAGWRYVWLTITCPTASSHPEFGYLYIGDYSSFPDDRNIGTGFEDTFQDDSMLSASDNGQIYGNDRTPVRIYSALEVGVAKAEVVAFLKNLYKLKQLTTPFFISLDPTNYFSDSPDEHIAFVRFMTPPKNKHILRNLFQTGFEVREAL